ncbi:MAG: phage holin family protein [Oscillospiraceae bacterium]|nr:phage holin family protein [Oscillospiraceae bacterium]
MRGFLWKCLGTIAAVVASAYLLPGARCADWTQAAAVGILLSVAYILFRPVARILLGVFNILTLGLMGVIIDAGLFYACAMKVEGFEVDSFAWALAAAVIVNAARLAFGMAAKVKRG